MEMYPKESDKIYSLHVAKNYYVKLKDAEDRALNPGVRITKKYFDSFYLPYGQTIQFLRATGDVISGIREGLWKFYYPNKNLESKLVMKVNYIKGELTYEFVTYNPNTSTVISKRHYFYNPLRYEIYIDLKEPSKLTIDNATKSFKTWEKFLNLSVNKYAWSDTKELIPIINMARLYSLQLINLK